MTESLIPVEPVSPVAPWIGGKKNLARRICAILDQIPCTTYAEPFVGMGGIFLRRTSRPRSEVINDAGKDVANLFRILQRHYPQFLDVLRFQLTTRTEFNRLVDTNPETLTDLERAARFLYLQRTAFGGKVSGRNFGVSIDRPARFNLTTLEPMLEDLHPPRTGKGHVADGDGRVGYSATGRGCHRRSVRKGGGSWCLSAGRAWRPSCVRLPPRTGSCHFQFRECGIGPGAMSRSKD